jgi:hypothetical protein
LEAEELALCKELGATWVRRNRWFTPQGDFISPGVALPILVQNNINVINSVEGVGGYLPEDYALFKEKLSVMVSQEKDIVKYWQLGNEPDLIWKMQGNSADDYIRFFLELSPIIRQECPDCKIVLGGISNQYDTGDNYEYFKTVLTKIKEGSTDSQPFDVFDLHLYPFEGDYNRAKKAPRDYKRLLEETGYDYPIELISTELGMYSGEPIGEGLDMPFQPEDVQAKMMVKMYAELFAEGVTKAFWVSITNFYKFGHENSQEGGIWDLVGLAYNGKGRYDLANSLSPGTKKLSFHAYKTFASMLQGKSEVHAVADGLYALSGGGTTIYLAWGETEARLPSFINGTLKVTDYAGNQRTEDASSIVLNDTPIFIEAYRAPAS